MTITPTTDIPTEGLRAIADTATRERRNAEDQIRKIADQLAATAAELIRHLDEDLHLNRADGYNVAGKGADLAQALAKRETAIEMAKGAAYYLEQAATA